MSPFMTAFIRDLLAVATSNADARIHERRFHRDLLVLRFLASADAGETRGDSCAKCCVPLPRSDSVETYGVNVSGWR